MNPAGIAADKLSGACILYAILIGSAVLCAAAYLGAAVLSPQFAYDKPFVTRPILIMLGLFSAAFVAHLLGLWASIRLPDDRRLMTTIVGAALLFRAILIPTTPILEVDIYRYIWDGTVTAIGVSPYRFTPQQVTDAVRASAKNSLDTDPKELQTLVDTCLARPSIATILRRVHYRELPTVYPPVSQAVFAGAVCLTPDDCTVAMQITVMKSVLILFDVATIALVIALLRLCGRHIGWSIVYAWCPLVTKEFANSGHLDSIAVFLTTAAIYVLARHVFANDPHNEARGRRSMIRCVAAMTILAFAVGAKIYPIIFLPMFCVTIARRLSIAKATVSIAVFVVVCNSVWIPMAGQTEGLEAYIRRWEMNDLLFMITYENLRPELANATSEPPWFSVAPAAWRSAVVEPAVHGFDLTSRRASFLVARCLTTGVWMMLAFWWACRVSTATRPEDWLAACFLTVAWFWLLSPTQNPWYWIWALPLAAFARGRAWLAVSGLVMIYYLRFWLRYHFETTTVLGTAYTGMPFFDYVVTWFEYIPWMFWLTTAAVWRRLSKARNTEPRLDEAVTSI